MPNSHRGGVIGGLLAAVLYSSCLLAADGESQKPSPRKSAAKSEGKTEFTLVIPPPDLPVSDPPRDISVVAYYVGAAFVYDGDWLQRSLRDKDEKKTREAAQKFYQDLFILWYGSTVKRDLYAEVDMHTPFWVFDHFCQKGGRTIGELVNQDDPLDWKKIRESDAEKIVTQYNLSPIVRWIYLRCQDEARYREAVKSFRQMMADTLAKAPERQPKQP